MNLPASFRVKRKFIENGIPHVVIVDTMTNIREQKSVVGDVHNVVRRVNRLFPKYRIVLEEQSGLTELVNEDGVFSAFVPFRSPKRDQFIALAKEFRKIGALDPTDNLKALGIKKIPRRGNNYHYV
jgi:hypothetical protein